MQTIKIRQKNKKLLTLKSYSLEEILEKKLRSKKFREAYNERVNQLKLARQIREARLIHRLTQKEVAKRAKMPQSVISRLESGRHNLSVATLQKVARTVGKELKLV